MQNVCLGNSLLQRFLPRFTSKTRWTDFCLLWWPLKASNHAFDIPVFLP